MKHEQTTSLPAISDFVGELSELLKTCLPSVFRNNTGSSR